MESLTPRRSGVKSLETIAFASVAFIRSAKIVISFFRLLSFLSAEKERTGLEVSVLSAPNHVDRVCTTYVVSSVR